MTKGSGTVLAENLTPEARKLALDILRCPVFDACLRRGGEKLGCYTVASWYSSQPSPHYVPEPWSGHLSAAPILYMSSNPGGGNPGEGINTDGTTNMWSDADLVGAFDSAFDPGQVPGIVDGTHLVDRTGKRSRAIRYLSWLWYTSRELLARDPRPGLDYAATEVVHCGTGGGAGVAEAFGTCMDRYFKRLMEVSPATVVICTGVYAARAFTATYNIRFADGGWGPGEVASRRRLILQVPHPNRRGSKWSLAVNVGDERLAQARSLLEVRP